MRSRLSARSGLIVLRSSATSGATEGVTESGERTAEILAAHGVTDADVVGIATDHCVRATALDAIGHGIRVRVLTDHVAGVAAESSAAALAELAHAGAELATVGA